MNIKKLSVLGISLLAMLGALMVPAPASAQYYYHHHYRHWHHHHYHRSGIIIHL